MLNMDFEEFMRRFDQFCSERAIVQRITDIDMFHRLALLERPRSVTLKDVAERAAQLLEIGKINLGILKWKTSTLADAKTKLQHMKKFIEQIPQKLFDPSALTMEKNIKNIEHLIKQEIVSMGWGTGDVLWPLRVALSGKEQSPSPFELLWALGRDESVSRIDNVITRLA